MAASQLPSHKVIPGCGFLVDGFRHAAHSAAKAFFLTHAHSDHYTGLKEDWSRGPIYCSAVTAQLVAHMLGVRPEYLCPLPLDTPTTIQGVEVTLVDANHCPGAVQFLFLMPDGRKYIHTGDMRFSPALLHNPHLQRFRSCDALFLDTTYANPRYCFPPQEESIEYVASTVQRMLRQGAEQEEWQGQEGQQQGSMGSEDDADVGGKQEQAQQAQRGGVVQSPQCVQHPQDEQQGQRQGQRQDAALKGGIEGVAAAAAAAAQPRRPWRRLYLVATYGIGKERLLTAIHDRCGLKMHVADRKHAVMQRLDLPGYDPADLFTTDHAVTPVHVVQWGFLGETWPFFRPNFKSMEEYRTTHNADEVVGFVPTGWLYEMKRAKFSVRSKGACSVHLVPYSEHSSFAELQDYVRFLRPHQVIPTVGVDGDDAEKARHKMQKHFRLLVDETAAKAKFLSAFGANSGGPAGSSGLLEKGGREEEEAEEEEGAGVEMGEEGNPAGTGVAAPDRSQGGAAKRNGQQARQGQGRSDASEVVDLAAEDSDSSEGRKQEEEEAEEAEEAKAAQPGIRAERFGPVRTPPLSPAAAATAAAKNGPHPTTSPAAGTAQAGAGFSADVATAAASSSSEPQLEQLLAVLGEGVSRQQGRQLLTAARGDVQAAANGFFDGSRCASMGGGSSGQQGGEGGGRAGTRGVSHSSDASRGGASAVGSPPAAGSKRPAPAPAGKGGKRQKGLAGAAAATGQRSIASFFGGGSRQQSQAGGKAATAAAAAVGGADGTVQGEVEAGLNEEEEEEELALTPGAPLASSAMPAGVPPSTLGIAGTAGAACAAGAGVGGSGSKPKLSLPPPPSSALPAGSVATGAALARPVAGTGGFFLRPGSGGSGSGGGGGAGSGSAREAAVSRDAMALPLDKYDPVGQACWEAGQPAPYLHISRALDLMEGTTKRLRISDVLTNCFRSLLALCPPSQLVAAAYLVSGRIAPDYEPGAELNVGGRTVSAAITEATGATRARLSDLYRELGDLGDVAFACKRTQGVLQRPAPLTVPGVFATLQQISQEKGQGAAGRRQRLVLSLLRSCRETETRFIVRTLVHALRVGANWRSVIPALGKAVVLHKEGAGVAKARLGQAAVAATAAFHVCPNLQLLTDAMLAHPQEEWQQACSLTPGIPVKPMLAKICEGLPDALQQLKGAPFLAEYKYDGMRAQIHLLADGQVRIFSRNCEDKTGAYPDVVQQMRDAAAGGASSAVVDAELVAVERGADGSVRLRAFQELATRKREDVTAGSVSVPVCIFVFDLLYLDGASLTLQPLAERRRQLATAFPGMRPEYFAQAESVLFAGAQAETAGAAGAAAGAEAEAGEAGAVGEETSVTAAAAAADATAETAAVPDATAAVAGGGELSVLAAEGQQGEQAGEEQGTRQAEQAEAGPATSLEDRLQECLLEAFAAGTEGLMLKSLTAPYEPSRRSDHWVKLKRDYCEGLHDTLDLVVIGAWYGQGRKAGWYSPFLLACHDPESGELQSVCRCISGFTDAFYVESLERLSKTVIPAPRSYFRTDERCSVWFDPREVWEIRGADLTLSPVHKAAVGRVHEERGLGLRFPRFLRIREDKGPEDATSAEQVAQMFHAQTRKVETAGQRLAVNRQQQQQQQQPHPQQQQGRKRQQPAVKVAQAGGAGAGASSEGVEGSEAEEESSSSEGEEAGEEADVQRRRREALDLGL